MAIQVREKPYDWQDGSCSFRATGYDERDLAHLVQVLQAMGLQVTAEELPRGRSVQIAFAHLPSRTEAERARTRGAGRHKKALSLPKGSVFNSETPVAEAAAWLDGHTAQEGMAALGIASRTTYYRRVRDIRRALELQEARTAARMADPARRDMGPVIYTLVDVTSVVS
jgi:hypothetical protein